MASKAPRRIVVTALALLAASPSAFSGEAPSSVPAEAQALIRSVHAASRRHDLAALAQLMDEGFVSSFGGEGGVNEALADWQRHPAKLDRLSRVTASPCEVLAAVVQCPRRAGTGYRAGFRLTAAGWRMVYFVAGD